jgi:hypothetical protein
MTPSPAFNIDLRLAALWLLEFLRVFSFLSPDLMMAI